jgi:hypothetical protein
MNFVVIGTDHRMQTSEPGFEGLLQALLAQRYFEPLAAIAEEYHDNVGESSAQRLAREHRLRWFNIDMTTEERSEAGILNEQSNRPGMFQETVAYRVPSDDVREQAWMRKLLRGGDVGTILVICGYLHFEALVQKLRAAGYAVDKRVYLETVPTIRAASAQEQ